MARAERAGQSEDTRDVILRLTVKEAEALREVCGCIFGEAEGTAREHTNAIHEELVRVGVQNRCSFTGVLSVKQSPKGPKWQDFIRGSFNP